MLTCPLLGLGMVSFDVSPWNPKFFSMAWPSATEEDRKVKPKILKLLK